MHTTCLILCLMFTFIHAHSEESPQRELRNNYEHACREPYSDINEHIPILYQRARECSSVVEIGLQSMNSSWGILLGLSESKAKVRSYLGIDIAAPPADVVIKARMLAEANGISFHFCEANDMALDFDHADMLFIDSLHTYCHLTYELEKFSQKIKKFICMHDTSGPWEHSDDTQYYGNYSEYPPEIDRTKRGLWMAVEDFLRKHPEWQLFERRENNNGFTTLKRVR